MTQPFTDPVSDIVEFYMQAMREAYDPDSLHPPAGKKRWDPIVRFFGGDGIPMAAWDAHSEGTHCQHPFLWVRIVRRYRTSEFPNPDPDITSCGMPRVVELEIGVGRCAVLAENPSWHDYAVEAETSLDDSYRIEMALCRANALARKANYTVATTEVLPYGPEGGVVAWMGGAYVQF